MGEVTVDDSVAAGLDSLRSVEAARKRRVGRLKSFYIALSRFIIVLGV